MSVDFKLDLKKLEKFVKALKRDDQPRAKLGVLGANNVRAAGPQTPEEAEKLKQSGLVNQVTQAFSEMSNMAQNAEIAKKHEFGEEGLPVRSILRVPIMDNMQKYLEQRGYFTKEAFAKIISESSLRELTAEVGIVGETIVSDAFDTGGFGKWQPSNMAFKSNHQTLVETRQLRDSITSEVDDGD